MSRTADDAGRDRLAILEHRRWRLAAAVISGGLLAVSHSLHPVWWLAWIAPLFLLVAAARAPIWEAAALGAVAGGVLGASLFSYIASVGGPAAAAIYGALSAITWAVVILVTRVVTARLPAWLAAFVYPTTWAAMDTVLGATSPHGTLGSLAYSQMDALPVIQVAAFAGTAGVVFLICLPAAAAALALDPRRSGKLAYAPAFVLAVAIVAGGLIRLSIPLQTVPVKVGLVSIDQPDSKPLDTTHEDPIWDAYFAGADRASAQGARVIVFTEAIALADSTRQGLLATRLSDAARRHAAYILAGVATQEGKLTRNRAWVFGPDGQQVASYAKHHLVPGFEASLVTPWNGYSTFQMDNKSIGVAICKDLDFPPLARRYGQLGVDALLIPAGDYDTDGWSHSRPAVLRGVENGFSIIRAAAHGRVTVADPYGRILAEAESRPAPGTVLVATANIGKPIPTLYVKIGDLFGRLCIGAIALALLASLTVRRRRPAAPAAGPSSSAPAKG